MSDVLTIRPLEKQDIAECAMMLDTAFAWGNVQDSVDELEWCFTDYPKRPLAFVALQDGIIVGYAMVFDTLMSPGCYGFRSITTHIDHQRRGIAQKVILAVENYVLQNLSTTASFLLVARDEAATALYKKLGYETTSLLHHSKPLMLKKVGAR